MATPPPLNPKPKKIGCAKGCLIAAAIGFAGIFVLGIVGSLLNNIRWKQDRANILNSVEQAVVSGEYERALSLADQHQSRNDPDLKVLVAKAQNLKREGLERVRKEQIEGLLTEIKAAQGEEREAKLERLLSLEPNTKQFPEELRSIREKVNQREKEARAKREAERQAEFDRNELARKNQARLEMEEMLAEFKWRYQVTTDELTSKPSYLAGVKSINQVNFDFPYRGAQRAELQMRTHPQYGKDLILGVQKGQILVRTYEDTAIKVVFDDGSPVTYMVVGPADHGTTSLFFRDYHGFVRRMLKAKKVKISVPFYQQGDVVFEFNVSDFDSEKYIGKN